MTSKVQVVIRSSVTGRFDGIALNAVNQAIAKQKSMGLNQYSHQGGRIIARNANGKFISAK